MNPIKFACVFRYLSTESGLKGACPKYAFYRSVCFTGHCGCRSRRCAPSWPICLSGPLVAPPPSSQRRRTGSLSRGTERRWRAPWRPQRPPSSPSERLRAFNPTAAAWPEPPSPSFPLLSPASNAGTIVHFSQFLPQRMQFTFPPLMWSLVSHVLWLSAFCGLHNCEGDTGLLCFAPGVHSSDIGGTLLESSSDVPHVNPHVSPVAGEEAQLCRWGLIKQNLSPLAHIDFIGFSTFLVITISL